MNVNRLKYVKGNTCTKITKVVYVRKFSNGFFQTETFYNVDLVKNRCRPVEFSDFSFCFSHVISNKKNVRYLSKFELNIYQF